MTAMRETAKAIMKALADKNDGSALAAECDYGEDLVDRITQALEAVYKQGAMSRRVPEPSEKEIQTEAIKYPLDLTDDDLERYTISTAFLCGAFYVRNKIFSPTTVD